MSSHLSPVEVVSDAALVAGKRALIWDAAWASITGAWSGGVVLVAFALSQGAGPMTIGLLASIPFMAQVAQLPTILLVERFRRRKMIGVSVLTAARIVILSLAFLPFVDDPQLSLGVLLASQFVIAVLGSVGACAINSWFHQLLPAASLGNFFGKRLLVAAGLACGATLSVGLLIDSAASGATRYAYAFAFLGAGITGLLSSFCLFLTPEPLMPAREQHVRMLTQLAAPFKEQNFRRLLFMLGSWSMASNIAAPFLTVYLIEQLHYELSTVTGMWVASQLANAAALYLWGRLSDRMPNKAILAVAFPLYFACTLGLVFADAGDLKSLQLALFYMLHIVMGMASGGIGLATGNMGLKFAPQGQGTA